MLVPWFHVKSITLGAVRVGTATSPIIGFGKRIAQSLPLVLLIHMQKQIWGEDCSNTVNWLVLVICRVAYVRRVFDPQMYSSVRGLIVYMWGPYGWRNSQKSPASKCCSHLLSAFFFKLVCALVYSLTINFWKKKKKKERRIRIFKSGRFLVQFPSIRGIIDRWSKVENCDPTCTESCALTN